MGCDDEENRKMAVKINVGIRRLDMATGLAFEPRGPNRNADHVQINSFLRQVSLQCLWIQKIKTVHTTSKIPPWFVNVGRFDEFYMILILVVAVGPSNLILEVFFKNQTETLQPF